VPEAKEEFLRAMEEDQKHYERLTELLKERHVKAFLAAGETEKAAARKAEKKAIEDARFVLPNACETKMVVTMNARSLQNFFHLRCCSRAQWEIRDAACAALAALRKTSPLLFSLYGPSCFVSGKCPEGRMTCGRQVEIQRKFSE
jgi:thymidylate synthase (FAD)